MPLYTKNGSIPSPQTDGTDGWVLVGDKPACPDGTEVVWLNWEWIVRDPKPVDSDGDQWNWAHETRTWVEYALPVFIEPVLDTIPPSEPAAPTPATSDPLPFTALTTDQMA